MYFKQLDLLRGLDKKFIKRFMDISEKEAHRDGYTLFQEGDRATYFYILLKGSVKISIGENVHSVYTVDRSGEAFGWSSLLGRSTYSASAECRESTLLLKIKGSRLQEILDDDPVHGLLFYKHLANILGDRLIYTYMMIPTIPRPEVVSSYGTGQIIESEANIL